MADTVKMDVSMTHHDELVEWQRKLREEIRQYYVWFDETYKRFAENMPKMQWGEDEKT